MSKSAEQRPHEVGDRFDGAVQAVEALMKEMTANPPLVNSKAIADSASKLVNEYVARQQSLKGNSSTVEWVGSMEVVQKLLASKQHNVTPDTIRGYKSILNKFAREYPVLPITPDPIEEYLRGKPTRSTASQNYGVLRILYEFAEERYGALNVMKKIKRPRFKRKEADCFTMEQVKVLLDVIETDRERALVYLYLGHGFRLSEATRLNIGEIDADRIYIHGKERDEWYPLLPEAREVLLKVANGRSADEPVFMSNQKRRLCPEMARENIRQLCKRAGINGMKTTPHTYRHTFSTLAYLAGCDKVSVSLLLRHKNENVTDQYLHLSSQQRVQLVREKLERYSPLRLVNDRHRVPLYTPYNGIQSRELLFTESDPVHLTPDFHYLPAFNAPDLNPCR